LEKDVARAHDQSEHLAVHRDDLKAGHVVHRGDQNFVEFFVHRTTIPPRRHERHSCARDPHLIAAPNPLP